MGAARQERDRFNHIHRHKRETDGLNDSHRTKEEAKHFAEARRVFLSSGKGIVELKR